MHISLSLTCYWVALLPCWWERFKERVPGEEPWAVALRYALSLYTRTTDALIKAFVSTQHAQGEIHTLAHMFSGWLLSTLAHGHTLCINYLAFARLNERFFLQFKMVWASGSPQGERSTDRGALKIPSPLTLFWIKYRNIGTWKKLIIDNTLKYTCIQLKVKGSVKVFFFVSYVKRALINSPKTINSNIV